MPSGTTGDLSSEPTGDAGTTARAPIVAAVADPSWREIGSDPDPWRRIVRDVFRDLWLYRNIVRTQVRVSLLKDLKRSRLGPAWIVLAPALDTAVWVVLKGAGVLESGDTGVGYAGFLIVGLATWKLFSMGFQQVSTMVVKGGRRYVMTNYPHELDAAAKIAVQLVHTALLLILSVPLLLWVGWEPTWTSLLYPVAVIPILLLGTAFGLVTSVFRVVSTDVGNLLDRAVLALFFLTPILYTAKADVGVLGDLVALNPLTPLVGVPRDLLLALELSSVGAFVGLSVAVLVIFLGSLVFFRRAEPMVLERLYR